MTIFYYLWQSKWSVTTPRQGRKPAWFSRINPRTKLYGTQNFISQWMCVIVKKPVAFLGLQIDLADKLSRNYEKFSHDHQKFGKSYRNQPRNLLGCICHRRSGNLQFFLLQFILVCSVVRSLCPFLVN